MNNFFSSFFSKIFVESQTTFFVISSMVLFFLCQSYLTREINISDVSNISGGNKYKFEINKRISYDLPNILSEKDLQTYKEIFSLQQSKKWTAADEKISTLDNKILIGHVVAQRILDNNFVAGKKTLENWINRYSDHPQAHKIYKVASKIKPLYKSISQSVKKDYLYGYGDNTGLTRSIEHWFGKKYWHGRNKAYNLWKKTHYYINKGRITYIYERVKSQKYKNLLKPTEISMIKFRIAEGYYAYDKISKALEVAEGTIEDGGKLHPRIFWVAGISSWQQGKWEKAAEYFSKMQVSKSLPAWDKSASGFWAYRAYKKIGNNFKALQAINFANQYPKTFYGTLASEILGTPHFVDISESNILTPNELNTLIQIPGVKRSIALLQIAKKHDAEKEIRRLYPKSPIEIKKKLVKLAHTMDIPGLEVKMASRLINDQSNIDDYLLFPVPSWSPEDGFTLNPALLFAFAKHESGFNPFAKSHAGARGLMQLMPQTASYIARKNKIKISRSKLYDPQKNLTVGQDYLEYLLLKSDVGGNIIFLAAAYNAGPNALSRWQKKLRYNNDPLLFIESIPSKETRNFVKIILTNYWIYQERLGYSTSTIRSVIDGNWPLYDIQKDKEEEQKIAKYSRPLN